ncbi:MAG: sulfite exporter TauE/SafE family protein [Bacteroidetes bacterium]|nr:sulfite exporter TauE/SafE family protein [Bacteroidota bacterium]
MSFLFVALVLGFAGSFHCIGMCGPIALALPVGRYSWPGRVGGVLLYNIGRMTTYSALGLVFGMIGRGFSLMGMQQVLSIVLGVLIIAAVIFPTGFMTRVERRVSEIPVLGSVKSSIQALFRRPGFSSFYLIGMLNGLLPCGFVYMALPMAMAVGTAGEGALFMAAFGAGTIPAMMVVSFSHSLFSSAFRGRVRQVMPVFMFVLGALLIVRGLNLGIPYLSPEATSQGQVLHSCCQRHH